jgi:hypothetical protein
MAITALIAQRRLGFGVGYLSAQSSFLCSLLRIKNFPPEVCRGLNNAVTVSGIETISKNLTFLTHLTFQPILAHILDKRHHLTATRYCGMVLQTMNCWTDDKYYDFFVKIDRISANPIKVRKLRSKSKRIQHWSCLLPAFKTGVVSECQQTSENHPHHRHPLRSEV